jgi:hypothetical protein
LKGDSIYSAIVHYVNSWYGVLDRKEYNSINDGSDGSGMAIEAKLLLIDDEDFHEFEELLEMSKIVKRKDADMAAKIYDENLKHDEAKKLLSKTVESLYSHIIQQN